MTKNFKIAKIIMQFYKIKYLYCINLKKTFQISYIYQYKELIKSYLIHYMHIKNKKLKLPVINFTRRFIGFSKLMFLRYKIYNTFDKTFFHLENIYNDTKYIYEIKDNYFIFPIEIEFQFTIHDKNNNDFVYPSSFIITPMIDHHKNISWYSIGNRTDYCSIKISIDDIFFYQKKRKRNIMTFIGVNEINFDDSKNNLLLYGNEFKELYYYTFII